jgi:pimeloyl-ACP methyl ester carboxylesterase
MVGMTEASPQPPAGPLPTSAPVVPEGRVIVLPGRGETFVRIGPSRPGAPTVALLHGWLASSDLNFFGAYAPLCARFNLIGIDHRGHGRGLRTEAPFALEAVADDFAEALAVVGIGPVIPVGYSMGGPIALHLARRHPELVAGLVLTATALEWRARWFDRVQLRLLGALAHLLRYDIGTRAAVRLINEMAATDEVVAAWRPHLIGEAKRLNVSDALAAHLALGAYDARPFAESLDVPAAVVITNRDQLVQPRRQRELAAAQAARVVEFDGENEAILRRPAADGAAITAAVDWVVARLSQSSPLAGRPDALGRPAELGSSRFGRLRPVLRRRAASAE